MRRLEIGRARFVARMRGVNLFFRFTARLKSGASRPYVVILEASLPDVVSSVRK
jgi:hypothetical protein